MPTSASSLRRIADSHRLIVLAVVMASSAFLLHQVEVANSQGGSVKVTTVSAASFVANEPVAPDSIVAAFGANLATGVGVAQGRPLPKQLAGTTVKVNDTFACLFFVSPSQVNYLIPAGTATGEVRVIVTSGDGTISQGTVQIAPVAPAIFTANASGQGVAAAVALRVKADGSQTYEPVSRFDATHNQFVTVPIELEPEGERVYLILFLSGVRGAEAGQRARKVQLLIGGIEAPHLYAGPTGDFDGLDQLNAEIPRALLGRGRVNLAVAANREFSAAAGKQDDFFTSNLVEIEIGAPRGGPRINSFDSASVLAGQTLTINGSGFSTTPAGNLVRVGGVEAMVEAATPERLMVRVPFGAETGPLTVRTAQGEAASAEPVKLRASVSGFVEDTNFKSLSDVAIKAFQTNTGQTDTGATTDQDGRFFFPDSAAGMDAPTGLQTIEINPAALPASLLFPTVRFKVNVQTNRDNQIARYTRLQQVSGPSLTFESSLASGAPAQAAMRRIATGGATFEAPANATGAFSGGMDCQAVSLTVVEKGRTPVPLPGGVFSSTIVQLTPFGVKLAPGGKLIFPNNDALPAGAEVKLYRSPTLGEFVEAGVAQVSADGARVETAANTITETGYFFVTAPRPTATVIGRVLASDGVTPLRRALVSARGRDTFTDGNGAYVLRDVVGANDLTVDARFQAPNSRVERALRTGIEAKVGSITRVDLTLALPLGAAPALTVPAPQSASAGQNLSFTIKATAMGQPLSFSMIDPPEGATLTPISDTEARFNWTARAGSYNLAFRVNDNNVPPQSDTRNVAITVVSGFTRQPFPGQGNIQALLTRGSDLFAGTSDGVFLSRDGGNNWTSVSSGLTNRNVKALAANGGSLFAGTAGGIFVSINDGQNWQAASNGLRGTNVLALAVSGGNLLAGSLDGGVSLSTNNGQSWMEVLRVASTYAFTLSGGNVFAGMVAQGVYRSTNNGLNWEAANGGLGAPVFALTSVGDTLFAGTLDGVFLSTNNGQQWQQAGLPGGISAFAVCGHNLFAGKSPLVDPSGTSVFLSADDGKSWTPVNGLANRRVLALAVQGNTLFAGTPGGQLFATRF